MLVFLIFFVSFSSLAVVSANENASMEVLPDSVSDEIYVSPVGSDFDGDGSFNAPYGSLKFAVDVANNNSKIVLIDGTYKGNSNTNININKDLTIESRSNGVTLDGNGENYFFNVAKGSSLVLNNIKFINGFTDSYLQLGIINNQGKLLVNNSSFSSMNSIMGTFLNEGELILDNLVVSSSYSKNLAQILTNVGKCTISNTKFNDFPSASNTLPTVYNYGDIGISGSQISKIISNNQYDEYNFKTSLIYIENSVLNYLNIEYADIRVINSKIMNNAYISYSNMSIDSSYFYSDGVSSFFTIGDSNINAIHTIFETPINGNRVNLNITYSAILDGIRGSGVRGDTVYAPYNWWGINSGPSIMYINNKSIETWAVLLFYIEDGNNSVGTNSKFISEFKWSDGENISDLNVGEYLPSRPIKFESQSGSFLKVNSNIVNSFSNYLIGNTVDSMVYCVVDNQRCSLEIGEGLSHYTYFVAPWGINSPDAGTYDNPFKTIKYAISRAVSGNTICLLDGVYKNNANSEINIDKNITLVGLGDVTFSRANEKVMFYIKEWGNLVIKNVDITVSNTDFHDNVFNVAGGNLTLINTTVHNIVSSEFIYTTSGIQSSSIITISDSKFSNIVGSIILGYGICYVDNCEFEKVSNYYTYSGYENYNALFSLKQSIVISNSVFKQNSMSIITLNPYYYSSYSLSSGYNLNGRYAYVINSSFINNVFRDSNNHYGSAAVGLLIHDSYSTFNGYVDNCTFIGNRGALVVANSVEGSTFIDNIGQAYGGESLVVADVINSSEFYGNLNRYVDGTGAYIGEGIASADTILCSIFINNTASFGGAVYNAKEVHYCVFVNNAAKYAGNDIFSKGNGDYSSNWWGDNQKPDSDKVFIFLGDLKLDDWVVMSFESVSAYNVVVSLSKVLDVNGNYHKLNVSMPIRPVQFITDGVTISPDSSFVVNNYAYANITYAPNASDFKVSAIIDNQVMDVDIRNSNTLIVMEDIVVKGNNKKFNLDLININGFKISNQTIVINIIDETGGKLVFSVDSDDKGHATFDIDFPIGKYEVIAYYLGNGYFDYTNSSATIEVSSSPTVTISFNQTYYGKNNKFYAILNDESGNNLVNFTLVFTLSDANGNKKIVKTNTDDYGRADIILNLDLGEYDIKVEFMGDDWYEYSYSKSHIIIKPVSTVLTVPDSTLYGQGGVYNITLKDIYGNLISGENVDVTITQGSSSDHFVLKTDEKGVARITINYLPGSYNVKVKYLGDKIYSATQGEGSIEVEKVLTIVSGFHYKVIPLKGIYSVVLSDMYGNRVNNGEVILKCYAGKLLKTYSGITDANGEVSFVIDLDEGTYLATIDYDGNTWYEESTNAATIVVNNSVKLESIYINSTDLIQYYGENKYFIIDFNDPNAYSQYGKNIVVSIASESWSDSYTVTTDVNGMARLQIKLNPGVYNITYKYSNPYYNIYGNGSNMIYVYQMPVTIIANDLIVKGDETRLYEVILRDVNNNPISNMQIKMKLNGDEYDVTTNYKGVASLPINLGVGEYNISYSISNPNYASASGQSRILVVDSDKTSSTLVGSDIESYDNQTVVYVVSLNDILGNGIAYSEVNMEIYTFDGEFIKKSSSFTDENGRASFDLDLECGKYLIKLSYIGNDVYLPSNSINSIDILSSNNKSQVIIFKNFVNLYSGQQFSVFLANKNGTLLSNKSVVFILNNVTYNSKTNEFGVAYMDLNLNPGNYAVKIIVEEDEVYNRASSVANFNILSNTTFLYAQKLVKYYRNGTQFHAQLLDSQHNPLAGKTIRVFVDGVWNNCTTDENGWITLNINLNPGHYEVSCYYYGDSEDEYSFDNTTIDVLPTVLGNSEVKYYGQSPYLTIKFLDGAGNPIRDSQFVISIDNNKYVAYTDSKGIFNFNLNLNAGIHKISVNNPYDGLVVDYTLEVLTTIETNTITKVLGDNKYYSVSLSDKDGNKLSNTNVDVIINGVKKVVKTDKNGEFKLSMELTPKNYLVTVINPVTTEYVEKTIKVLHPVSSSDLVMYYQSGSYFKVRIIGAGGKVAGSGQIVKFTINKKTYSIKTDKNGYASLKINLNVGKYKIASKYNGYTKYNYITVKSLLSASDMSKKKGYVTFSAKLVNSNGKAAQGKKIVFKFKNKKYVSKTNSKGIAYIKLKLNRAGKYYITSSYGKMSIKNKIVIK